MVHVSSSVEVGDIVSQICGVNKKDSRDCNTVYDLAVTY